MPRVLLNGCSIHYEVAGDGAPLLFMHGGFGGLGTGAVTAEPFAWYEEFTKKYKVITFDRRSSGRSSAPESPHSLELFADDGLELLRHLGIPGRGHMGGVGRGRYRDHVRDAPSRRHPSSDSDRWRALAVYAIPC